MEIENWEMRIAHVAKEILARRHGLDFMTVARALVLSAGLECSSKRERLNKVSEVARCMQISRQTKNNWLKRDLGEWLGYWERRLDWVAASIPPPVNRKKRITGPDWDWMAGVLVECPGASWKGRQRQIMLAAARDPRYGHLRKISEVTLWRNRSRLWVMMEKKSNQG